MGLKDLNKLNIKDLQNIDVGEVKKFLFSRLDVSICILIGVLSAAISIFIMVKKINDISSVRAEIQLKHQILAASKEQMQIKEELTKFKTGFPEKLDEESMIQAILKAASQHLAKISSFSPAQEESDQYKKTTRINLTVNTDNFDDMILFIKSIESLPYSIKIDFWSGSQPSQIDSTIKFITSNMKISSIELLK